MGARVVMVAGRRAAGEVPAGMLDRALKRALLQSGGKRMAEQVEALVAKAAEREETVKDRIRRCGSTE